VPEAELRLDRTLRYSHEIDIGEGMITPDVLTEYLRRMMPDAAVTVLDRTGTMDHLKVVVISAAFVGKNLLDRHRLVYQALDAPMKDGRIHALELTAKTTDEA
jgi:stress-induced morphogen